MQHTRERSSLPISGRKSSLKFPLIFWFFTRVVILVAFLAAEPHGVAGALGNWDGAWYGSIVHHGYAFATDGKKYNVAFFPLFPLLSTILVRAGIAWPLAGALVNNFAFLVAMLLLYRYTCICTDERTARWVTVATCASPPSLFCSVAYSEGVFLLFSAVVFWAVCRRQYLYAGIAAAAAAATRPFGAALAFALLISAIVERRNAREVLAAATGLIGVVAFPAYCLIRFGDAFATVHAAHAWRHVSGFDGAGWLALARGALLGNINDRVSLFLIAVGIPCAMKYHRSLNPMAIFFIAFSLFLILFAGPPISVGRYIYACVPFLIVLGIWFRRFPFIGYSAAVAGLAILFLDAMAFARFQWVG